MFELLCSELYILVLEETLEVLSCSVVMLVLAAIAVPGTVVASSDIISAVVTDCVTVAFTVDINLYATETFAIWTELPQWRRKTFL